MTMHDDSAPSDGFIHIIPTCVNRDHPDSDDVAKSVMPQTLQEWQTAIHTAAREKGWWPASGRCPIEMLVLCHAEVSEAMEEYRNGGSLNIVEREPSAEGPRKPVGFATEIADLVIRLLDFAGGLKIPYAPSGISGNKPFPEHVRSIPQWINDFPQQLPTDISTPTLLFLLHECITYLGVFFEEKQIDESAPKPLRQSRQDALYNLLRATFFAVNFWKIDLQDVMEKKHAFNLTRAFRHGNKLA